MGVPIHILSDGTLPIRSSAIEAVPLFPRPGFVQSAACGFRSLSRGIAATLLISLYTAACSSGAAAPQPQELTLMSGIAAAFSNDLVKRFNSALGATGNTGNKVNREHG